MSTNADFAAEPFEPAPNASAFHSPGPGPQAFAQGDWAGAGRSVTQSKPNLVVRVWRSIKGFVLDLGRAIFTVKFWRDLLLAVLRDALAATRFSLGVRMVKSAAESDSLAFQDKETRMHTTGVSAQSTAAGAAFSDDSRWRSQQQPRRYASSLDDFTASPTGSQGFGHGTFSG